MGLSTTCSCGDTVRLVLFGRLTSYTAEIRWYSNNTHSGTLLPSTQRTRPTVVALSERLKRNMRSAGI
ncbi:hypothetical protein SCLCIDRAFT_1211737 [Scleroderma citrinum Foug A]|uniref:Uncharacterized protein n=1 Tax=Scleroderma citrinum Foug A TaxID=1036808 RepID=A0A0C2ZWA7_9AGAM|nr:hypothetical protein SCLCIDRAFT_1211737 [Scleroderma citrinum Foug A]